MGYFDSLYAGSNTQQQPTLTPQGGGGYFGNLFANSSSQPHVFRNPVVQRPKPLQQKPNPIQQAEQGIGNFFSGIKKEFTPSVPKLPNSTPLGKKLEPQPLPSGLKLDFVEPSQNADAHLKITPNSLKQEDKSVKDAMNSPVMKAANAYINSQTGKSIKNILQDPLSLNYVLKTNPKQWIKPVLGAISNLPTEATDWFKQFEKNWQSFGKGKTLSKKIGNSLTTVASEANTAFEPITTLFNAASNIPAIGSVVKLITLPFTAIGDATPMISNQIIDRLPLSQQAKNDIKPGVGEILSLAAQLALGKATEIDATKMADLKSRFGEADAQTIVDKAKELATEKINSEKQPTTNDIIKPGEYSPQEIRKTLLNSSIKNTPEAQQIIRESINAENQGKNVKITASDQTPVKEVGVPRNQLPVGTGNEKVSSLDARVASSLKNAPQEIKDQLGTATYNEMNKQENITKASEYVLNNPEDALKVLTGEKEAPQGILRNSIYVAMANLSPDSVDLNIARKVASLTSTRAGQEISILSELDKNSPIAAMSKLVKEKIAIVEQKLGKPINEAIKSESKKISDNIKKIPTTKNDWGTFIDSIQC